MRILHKFLGYTCGDGIEGRLDFVSRASASAISRRQSWEQGSSECIPAGNRRQPKSEMRSISSMVREETYEKRYVVTHHELYLAGQTGAL